MSSVSDATSKELFLTIYFATEFSKRLCLAFRPDGPITSAKVCRDGTLCCKEPSVQTEPK